MMPLPSEEVTPPVTKMYLVEPVIALWTAPMMDRRSRGVKVIVGSS
jgi:hypothetical protein